jgi:hypothetical protein
VIDVPVSKSITMRPTWRRRQLRKYMQSKIGPPTELEIEDAIRVLRDPENRRLAPALFNEAVLILEEVR